MVSDEASRSLGALAGGWVPQLLHAVFSLARARELVVARHERVLQLDLGARGCTVVVRVVELRGHLGTWGAHQR